ncbi:hypothetical protein REPUB_Repub03eG0013300 [Reevesia pubescens]
MDPARKRLLITAVIVVCFSLTAIVLSLCCLWIFHRKKSQKSSNQDDDKSSEDAENGLAVSPFLGRYNSLRTLSMNGFASFIDYKMIEKGTKKFNDINILGEGGFGHVYKAILDNGSEAAVKKLNCSTQYAQKEFENEVELLSRFHHPNVISSLGYSIENETGFIVYELMHNGSLETQLHGPSRGSELTWHRRMKIALDIARGLEYLHELCIPSVIHRDLKSSNILLDSNFNAKLSDFGLAVTVGKESEPGLKLSGTIGYMAPEYIFHGILTDMSDTYSFGVVLMELLLGRKPIEMLETTGRESLVRWAKGLLTNVDVMRNIVDPVIRGTMDVNHLHQVATVAYLCVQEEPAYRPLITDILHSLIPLVPVELGGTLKV